MNSVLLNQAGIVLNFLAGFMIAPELIGIDRLKILEEKIENITTQLETIVRKSNIRIGRKISHEFRLPHILIILVTITLITLFVLTKNYLWVWVVYFAFCFLLAFEAMIAGNVKKDDILSFLGALIIVLILVTIFGVVILGYSAYIFIFFGLPYLLLYLFRALTGWVVSRLEGERRLQAILVSWGIVFFILGNLFQFVATLN